MIRVPGSVTALAALAVFATAPAAAVAQGGGAGRPVTPTTSPYLNLLRRTSNVPGVNYYGIVRPELQTRNTLQDLQQQVTANRQAVSGPTAEQGPGTGVVGSFLNTGGYFMNMNAAGTGGAGGPGAARFGSGGASRGSAAGRSAPPRR